MHSEIPPVDLPYRDRPDDLDGLLRSFFRSQLPDPWPAPPRPRAEVVPLLTRPAPSRWTLARSRFALAASVAVLVTCLWALAGKFAANPGAGLVSPLPGTVTGERDPNKIRVKESLLQDPKEGTKILIEVFDK